MRTFALVPHKAIRCQCSWQELNPFVAAIAALTESAYTLYTCYIPVVEVGETGYGSKIRAHQESSMLASCRLLTYCPRQRGSL